MTRLAGRIAVVTGSSRGIGEAIATAMAREGARVVVTGRKEQGCAEAAARINASYPGMATPRACHVGKPEAVEALFAFVSEELGLPDILVNNAGTNPWFGPMLDCPPALFDKTFEVNLKGYFACTRAFAKGLIAAGKPGAVVSTASILGQGASPLQGVYGMTKAAVISMTQTLAFELGPAGIRVNAIAPGLVRTRLAAALTDNPDLLRHYTDRTGLGRAAEPDEVAGAAVFLASEEASYITGAVLNVDAGYRAS